MDGVVRIPSAFTMSFGVLASIAATQHFVVPKSMPITVAMGQLRIRESGRGLTVLLHPYQVYWLARVPIFLLFGCRDALSAFLVDRSTASSRHSDQERTFDLKNYTPWPTRDVT